MASELKLYQPCEYCKSYNLCDCMEPCPHCKSNFACDCEKKKEKKKKKGYDSDDEYDEKNQLYKESLKTDNGINMEVDPYSNKIVNLYERLTDDCNPMVYRNKYDHLPQHPMRALVIGGSSAGKTNLLLNLIMMMQCFDVLYLYSPAIDEPIYVGIRKYFGDRMHAFRSLLDIMKGKEYQAAHPGKQICIIFDDVMNKKSKLLSYINELYSAGRKCNLSTVFISQSYYRIPKETRLQANIFIVKDIATKRDRNMVMGELAMHVDPEELKEMYDDCQSDGYDAALVIDRQTKNKNKMYRKGFNQFYQIDADTDRNPIPQISN